MLSKFSMSTGAACADPAATRKPAPATRPSSVRRRSKRTTVVTIIEFVSCDRDCDRGMSGRPSKVGGAAAEKLCNHVQYSLRLSLPLAECVQSKLLRVLIDVVWQRQANGARC